MERFEFIKTKLEGAYFISSQYSADHRGGLIKDYNEDIFRENGISHQVRETFYTISKKGVIRAIHFQKIRQQAKLVRCISGKVYDVIVDLRASSPTYRQWTGIELSGENRKAVYIPKYFGHGYLVLEDSVVSYQCDENFYARYDSGIIYNDPDINIRWPYEKIGGEDQIILSEKDRMLPSLKEYEKQAEEGGED